MNPFAHGQTDTSFKFRGGDCAAVVAFWMHEHKRGADAFEHYFGFPPPKDVALVQAHWAGFYIATGLDAEQMRLEFTAPPKHLQELLRHDPAKEVGSVSKEVRREIVGYDDDFVGPEAGKAPVWFKPVDGRVFMSAMRGAK